MSAIDKQKLVAKIQKAFENTPQPKNGFVGYELDAFENKDWQAITVKDLRRHRDEFISLSPDGFRYVIPAILIHIILDPEEADTAVDNIIRTLAPPEPDDLSGNRFYLRLKLLSLEEKKAIAAFLKAYRGLFPYGNYEIDEAFRMTLDKAITFWRVASE